MGIGGINYRSYLVLFQPQMHFSEVQQQFSEQYMRLLAGSVALL